MTSTARPLSQPLAVSFSANNDKFREKALEIAEKLRLPFEASLNKKEKKLVLLCDNRGVSLCQFQGRRCRLQRVLFVDFLHGRHGYRLAHNRTIDQNLAKAVGIKPGYRPNVVDATAGLGGDAFVLASLGCKVQMHERNPIVAILLEDGLQRAAAAKKTEKIIANMTLRKGDSRQLLTTAICDTIYLDPMYPYTPSHAEKKLAMRILRAIVGDDSDTTMLMTNAEQSPARRITVKRPRNAPYISQRLPDAVIRGKSCRYDVYFPKLQTTAGNT